MFVLYSPLKLHIGNLLSSLVMFVRVSIIYVNYFKLDHNNSSK